MKIALVICPALFKRCPLIGLGYLSAYLRQEGHQVNIFDLNTEIEVPFDHDEQKWSSKEFVERFISEQQNKIPSLVDKILENDPEVIGFSVWATTRHASLMIARIIKERSREKIIVFGGPECSFTASDLIRQEQVDVVVYGEGEKTFIDIVEMCDKKGKIDFCPGAFIKNNGDARDCGFREEIENLDSLPFPDYSDFSLFKYYSPYSISMAFYRGCLRRCVFCNCAITWKNLRSRTAKNIFDEMIYQYRKFPHLRKFEVDDTAINLNLPMVSELCDLIIANGFRMRWGGSALVRREMDTELIRKMAKAGCNCLGFGLESGSQRVVDMMGKGFRTEDAERVIRDTYEAGIETILGIIIGFPGETEEDFQMTLEFIKRNKAFISKVNFPSECCIGCNSYMKNHLEKFDVVLEPNNEGNAWYSKDGTNTHKTREKRIETFNNFLNALGVPLGSYATVYQEKNIIG